MDETALTAEQQAALEQFTAVTAAPPADAIALLARCQWNVQIAIARFFDGEPAEDPVAAAQAEAAAQAPRDSRRAENLMSGLAAAPRSSSSSSRRVPVEPAPRVVPQPESQVDTRAPLVLALLWAPVSLLYSLAARWFRFMAYLFPFVPRAWGRVTASNVRSTPARRSAGRRPLNPRDTAARFIREFEEEYGPNELPFHEGGYASAFDVAKKELKFLLVVLVSPEHDLTAPFLRDTLLAPSVVSFLRDPANNMLLWAGSVVDAEAYAVSSALNCTKFPFSALIVHTPSVSSTAMGIATRISGPTPPSQYLAKLTAAMSSHTDALSRIRAQRAEQTATRSLRAQQDSAYERSLALDRERKRKAAAEAEAAKAAQQAALAAQQAAQTYAANLKQWRAWRAKSIPPEPRQGEPAVRVSLRLPDAQRVVRSFPPDADMETLYAFVECRDELAAKTRDGENEPDKNQGEADTPPHSFTPTYNFLLVSPMPREVYELSAGGTLRERIGRSGNLIVEMLGEEGDEDDEDDGEGGEA